MLRSCAATRYHEGISFHRGRSPGGRLQGFERDRPLRGGHAGGLGRRHVGGELLVEGLAIDVQVGRAVAAAHGPQRVAECAAGEALSEQVGALAGLRRERGDVDEPGDLAGVGVDVRDHHAAVGVADEHDRAVDVLTRSVTDWASAARPRSGLAAAITS